MANIIKVSGSLRPSTINTPLDARTVINSMTELSTVQLPYEGMLLSILDEDKVYVVTDVLTEKGNPFIDETNIKPVGGGASVLFSDNGETPADTSVIWVDGSDIPELDESAFDKIREELNKLNARIDNMEYVFDMVMDSGDTSYYAGSDLETIDAVEPGTEGENTDAEESIEPTWAENMQPNVRHICIKRANSTSAITEYKDHAMDGELVYSVAEGKLYIGHNGKLIALGGGSSTGGNSNNVTANYIDLVASDNSSITYRITVNSNGELIIENKEIYDGESLQPLAAGMHNLKGLVINMVYAGASGATASSENICSHSFIELYNSSDNDINLKGCSICVGVTTWNTVIPLMGTIPSKGYYLVRLNPVSNVNSATTKVVIDEYDIDAYAKYGASIDNLGFKIYLLIGNTKPTEDSPWDSSNGRIDSSTIGYIDLIGAMGKDYTGTVTPNAGEFAIGQTARNNMVLGNTRGIFRNYLDTLTVNGVTDSTNKIGSGDSNNNVKDFRAFDYSKNTSDITDRYIGETTAMFKPRTSKSGKGDIYRFKSKFATDKPNMPTVCIGESSSTRTFTWSSVADQIEYLFYKKQNTTAWVSVPVITDGVYAKKQVTGADNQIYYVNKVIVRDLVAGIYEWCCGTISSDAPGSYKSETFTFVVTENSLNHAEGEFTFCQVSDLQGWAFNEYDPWAIALKQIVATYNANSTVFPTSDGIKNGIEFLVNTGDMSQNGSRPSEWLDYFNSGIEYLPNVAQMNCVGNNDLCKGVIDANGTTSDKAEPTTFEYYYTYEYSNNSEEFAAQKVSDGMMKSVYSFDYGCAHFVCLNSNGYSSIPNTQGNSIEEMKTWFRKHMDNVKLRNVQPKWIIVYMHDAPFNIMTKSTEHNNEVFKIDLTTPNSAGLRDSGINLRSSNSPYSWSRLLEEYGVDVVLSGHKHTYSRTFPLVENVLSDDIKLDTTLNPNGYPVNPWEPLRLDNNNSSNTLTEYSDRTIEVNGEFKKAVTYVMCQATGYKLQSNKDVPSQYISWLAKYFEGSINSSNKAVVNSAQKNPTFIMWTVTPTELRMNTYMITNLTTGAQWDHMGNGEAGTYKPAQIAIAEIDSMVIKNN